MKANGLDSGGCFLRGSLKKLHHVPKCRKVVERQVLGRLDIDLELFGQFTEELCLLDAIDTEITFKISVEFDHFFGIAGLLDNEIDEEHCWPLC